MIGVDIRLARDVFPNGVVVRSTRGRRLLPLFLWRIASQSLRISTEMILTLFFANIAHQRYFWRFAVRLCQPVNFWFRNAFLVLFGCALFRYFLSHVTKSTPLRLSTFFFVSLFCVWGELRTHLFSFSFFGISLFNTVGLFFAHTSLFYILVNIFLVASKVSFQDRIIRCHY